MPPRRASTRSNAASAASISSPDPLSMSYNTQLDAPASSRSALRESSPNKSPERKTTAGRVAGSNTPLKDKENSVVASRSPGSKKSSTSTLANTPSAATGKSPSKKQVPSESDEPYTSPVRNRRTTKVPLNDSDEVSKPAPRRRGRPRKSEAHLIAVAEEDGSVASEEPRKASPPARPRRTRRTTRRASELFTETLQSEEQTVVTEQSEITHVTELSEAQSQISVPSPAQSRRSNELTQSSTNGVVQAFGDDELYTMSDNGEHETDSEELVNPPRTEEPQHAEDSTIQLDRSLAESEDFTMVSIESLRQQQEQARKEAAVKGADQRPSADESLQHSVSEEHSSPKPLPPIFKVPRRKNRQSGSNDGNSSLITNQTPQEQLLPPAEPPRPTSARKPSPNRRISGAMRAGAMLHHAVSDPVDDEVHHTPNDAPPFLGFGDRSARGLRESLLIGERLRHHDDRPTSQTPYHRLPTPVETLTSDTSSIQSDAPRPTGPTPERASGVDISSVYDPMSWRKEAPEHISTSVDDASAVDAMSWRPERSAMSTFASSHRSRGQPMSWQPTRPSTSNLLQQASPEVASTDPTVNIDDVWQEEVDRSLEDSMTGARQRKERRPRASEDTTSQESPRPISGRKRSHEDGTENLSLRDVLGEDNRPFRSKIPRTWRRTSDHSFLYSDEVEEPSDKQPNQAGRKAQTQSSPKRPEVPTVFRRLGISPPEQASAAKKRSPAKPRGVLSTPRASNGDDYREPTPKSVRFADGRTPGSDGERKTSRDEDYFSSSEDESNLAEVFEDPFTESLERPSPKLSRQLHVPGRTYQALFDASDKPSPKSALKKNPVFTRNTRPALSSAAESANEPGLLSRVASWFSFGQSEPVPKPGTWRPSEKYTWGRNQEALLQGIFDIAMALEANKPLPLGKTLPQAYLAPLPAILRSEIGQLYFTRPKCLPDCPEDCPRAAAHPEWQETWYCYYFTEVDARIAHTFITTAKSEGVPQLIGDRNATRGKDKERALTHPNGRVLKVKEDWSSPIETLDVANSVFSERVERYMEDVAAGRINPSTPQK